MKRVLVVPWSTAPTKSAIACLHVVFGGLLGQPSWLLGTAGAQPGQEPADQPLVQAGAEHTADDGRHDRDPEIEIPGLIAECAAVARQEAGESRTEVTRRV